ncbi:MAG TPA: adenosylcobinamide-GDP ribazoletransferase [Leptolyngbyaceae cyanobacterium M33_DOE_097]|uniref:Adenosylcobinamide-GDP ribazoletransferase n=1 Tax=Oscillatoriales cyanobacterium SpSt-418 TaxID=2282169 RepID=A0A7C3PG50_9CYAN|nr:adenosylcobinamide-GDP ribazoletransferase [Leptolyngbyaceae cyanobacterium M33_DOE_097]
MTQPSPAPRSPLATFLGAVTFYTCIPLPPQWPLNFHGIACWAPVIGLLMGAGLGGLDKGLEILGLEPVLRSAIVVLLWLGITGGLHLDGAMDTADGLAVLDPQRRLDVMADSRSGAFGVMAAIAILLLKTLALADLAQHRWLGLMLAAGWGRWGQLLAIVRDPYLKPTGKGAFHKQAIRSGWAVVPSYLLLLGVSALWPVSNSFWWGYLAVMALGSAISTLTGAYFCRRLGGQTGDTYGAIVEWTETVLLSCLVVF